MLAQENFQGMWMFFIEKSHCMQHPDHIYIE